MLYVSTNINLVLSSMGRECISSIVLSLISDILARSSFLVEFSYFFCSISGKEKRIFRNKNKILLV